MGLTFGRNVCRIRSRRSEMACREKFFRFLVAELALGDSGANHLVVIAASFVAAQNVSSGRMWRNAALVMCGHQSSGCHFE